MDTFYTYEEKISISLTNKDWKQAALEYWAENEYVLEDKTDTLLTFEFKGSDSDMQDKAQSIKRRAEVLFDADMLVIKISALEKLESRGPEAENIVKCLFEAEVNGLKDVLLGFLDYSDKNMSKLYAIISIVILLLLGIGFGGYFVKEKFFSHKSHVEISNFRVSSILKEQKNLSPQVMIVPFGDFDSEILLPIAARLSEDMGLIVKVSPSLAVPHKNVYNPRSGRFDASRLGFNLKNFSNSLPEKTDDTTFVAVLSASIESEKTSLNEILFYYIIDDRHTIVSAHELGSMHILRTRERLYRLIKRSIWVQRDNKQASVDRKSIMYTPIREVGDLDKMQFDY